MHVEGDFWADGAVCVRGAFSPEEVALAREAVDANLADLSPLAKRASGDDDGASLDAAMEDVQAALAAINDVVHEAFVRSRV